VRVAWAVVVPLLALMLTGCRDVSPAGPAASMVRPVRAVASAADFEALRGQPRPLVLVLTDSRHGCGCDTVLPLVDDVAVAYKDRVTFVRADDDESVGHGLSIRYGGQILGEP